MLKKDIGKINCQAIFLIFDARENRIKK